jgi:hypothetical protein
VRTHTNLQLEHRLELYEDGMLAWDLEMTVEEPLSDDEDEDGVPHCVSDSESESETSVLFFYFIFTFLLIFYLPNQCTQIAHFFIKTQTKNTCFLSRHLNFRDVYSLKKKSQKKIHTARLPHVHRTCGCAVNLPHNRTCGAASLGGYIVNLLDFYSYRLIEKLTAFLQLQEFRQRNPTVATTSAARRSPSSLKAKLAWLLPRQQPYVST